MAETSGRVQSEHDPEPMREGKADGREGNQVQETRGKRKGR